MYKDFESWLLNEGYTENTSKDYSRRVQKVSVKLRQDLKIVSYATLCCIIDSFRDGRNARLGRQSHNTVSNSLVAFANFKSNTGS